MTLRSRSGVAGLLPLRHLGSTDFLVARTCALAFHGTFEHTLDANHPTIASVVKNLGDVATYEGRFDDATRFYTRALELYRHADGLDPR